MNKEKFFETISDSFINHTVLVRKSLGELDELNKIIAGVKYDLEKGPIKEAGVTIHASTGSECKLTVRVYMKHGTGKYAIYKHDLLNLITNAEQIERQEVLEFVPKNKTFLREMVDSVFSTRVKKLSDVEHACKCASLEIELDKWLWDRVDRDLAERICLDALIQVSKQDLDDTAAKKKYDQQIAIRRLKKSLKQASQSYSGYRENRVNAKLPTREEVIRLIQGNFSCDGDLGYITGNGGYYSRYGRQRPTGEMWKGFTGKRKLIFIEGYLRQARRGTAIVEYEPTVDDINVAYDYLIAQEILDS